MNREILIQSVGAFGGTLGYAFLLNAPMRTVPESSPRMEAAVWLSCSALLRRFLTAGRSRSPSPVRRTPARERVIRAKPSSFYSASIP